VVDKELEDGGLDGVEFYLCLLVRLRKLMSHLMLYDRLSGRSDLRMLDGCNECQPLHQQQTAMRKFLSISSTFTVSFNKGAVKRAPLKRARSKGRR